MLGFVEQMLFYAKKHIALELLVALVLGGIGWFAARHLGVALPIELDFRALVSAATMESPIPVPKYSELP